MNASKIALAGGGMVAGYAAKQMVELGLKPGELAILSADTVLPYERPPLSKGFLAGKDGTEHFFHVSGVIDGSFGSLGADDEVEFESRVMPKGPQAYDVRRRTSAKHQPGEVD